MRLIQTVNRNGLPEFFDEFLHIPDCNEKTKSYIISVFTDITSENDFSNQSVTLLYATAHEKISFNEFKNIGDWLFLTKSLFPDSLQGASPAYYNAIAQSSYYKCYLLLNRQWLLFEELADQFPVYTQTIHAALPPSLSAGT